jgi:hypothetical protein
MTLKLIIGPIFHWRPNILLRVWHLPSKREKWFHYNPVTQIRPKFIYRGGKHSEKSIRLKIPSDCQLCVKCWVLLEQYKGASRVWQWSKALHRCARGNTTDQGARCVTWSSVIRVRGGFGRGGFTLLIVLATPCGGPGACRLTLVVSWTVIPPTHWCGWLPG